MGLEVPVRYTVTVTLVSGFGNNINRTGFSNINGTGTVNFKIPVCVKLGLKKRVLLTRVFNSSVNADGYLYRKEILKKAYVFLVKQVHTEAERIFQAVGKLLKQRRGDDAYENLHSYLQDPTSEDPAAEDPELARRLEEQGRAAKQKLERIFDQFVEQQVDKRKTHIEEGHEDSDEAEEEEVDEEEETERDEDIEEDSNNGDEDGDEDGEGDEDEEETASSRTCDADSSYAETDQGEVDSEMVEPDPGEPADSGSGLDETVDCDKDDEDIVILGIG
jgi:hypothetical protein